MSETSSALSRLKVDEYYHVAIYVSLSQFVKILDKQEHITKLEKDVKDKGGKIQTLQDEIQELKRPRKQAKK